NAVLRGQLPWRVPGSMPEPCCRGVEATPRCPPRCRAIPSRQLSRNRSLIGMIARLIFAAAALAIACASAAAARDLTIVSRGGGYQEAQRSVYFKPFTAATGIPIQEQTWGGGLEALRAHK